MTESQLYVHPPGGYSLIRSYVGMCRPKGMVLRYFRLKKGVDFAHFALEYIAHRFRGNYGSIWAPDINVFVVSKKEKVIKNLFV